MFDGRFQEKYTPEALKKVALISDDLSNYVKKKFPLDIASDENEKS